MLMIHKNKVKHSFQCLTQLNTPQFIQNTSLCRFPCCCFRGFFVLFCLSLGFCFALFCFMGVVCLFVFCLLVCNCLLRSYLVIASMHRTWPLSLSCYLITEAALSPGKEQPWPVACVSSPSQDEKASEILPYKEQSKCQGS